MLGRSDHEGDFVVFHAAGAKGAGDYRCAECKYGITISGELPVCPMCSSTTWESTSRPSDRAANRLQSDLRRAARSSSSRVTPARARRPRSS
jgi:hypothetical protein